VRKQVATGAYVGEGIEVASGHCQRYRVPVAPFPLPLVLDTNIARFERLETVERLASQGFRLRIAETAFLEWGAACVRGWEQEGWSRCEARKKFFGRARSLTPFIDPEVPIALDGGLLSRRIVAQADDLPPFEEANIRERDLKELWRRIVGVGMSDEEFTAAGKIANQFLDELDDNFIQLARREAELRKNPLPDGVDATVLAAGYMEWDGMSEVDQSAHLRRYATESWRLSISTAERLDGHVCTTAYRLHAAARGARMPKRNDGADISLTLHLGAGCILLTKESQLVHIVDSSGSFQAPWVRRPNELDDLPDGVPWGDSARRQAASFKRQD
jgi:hypothetical protein